MLRPPAPPTPGLEHAGLLYGWREIGQYLRRSKPTVLAWHKQRPMPISRLGMSVVIPRAALDLWVMAAPSTTQAGRHNLAPEPEAA
jgi:excisionase family DNA binding protein